MKKNILFLMILLVLGCGKSPVYYSISSFDEAAFKELLIKYPLPEGFLPAKNGEEAIVINLKLVWSGENIRPDQKILKRIPFVPVVNLWDKRENITKDEVDSVELLPLHEVELPMKGVSFAGLYPGEKGYSLVKEHRLFISSDNELPGELTLWLQGISEAGGVLPEIAWIGGVGDVMPGEGAQDLMLTPGGYKEVFGDTLPVLLKQDLMLGNLEAPATYHDVKVPKSFNYKFNPPLLEELKKAGFDYFAFTNNHCFDYGQAGLVDTIKNLKKYNVPTSGVGMNFDEAAKSWKTSVKGHEVVLMSAAAYPVERNGFDGYSRARVTGSRPGILWTDEKGFEAMEKVFNNGSFNIVMVHGGQERVLEPVSHQIQTYRRLIDIGADLVLGSHPHAVQGMEVYKGGLIAYSLGNFIFPDEVIYIYAQDTAILSLGVYNNRIRYVKVYPVHMQGAKVRLDPSNPGAARLLDLTEALNKNDNQ